MTSGAFCLSSNRAETFMGGAGWIIDPDGAPLAVTTGQDRVAIADLDLQQARSAKQSYPRYVSIH